MTEKLLVKETKYYISCSNCGKITLFNKYDSYKYCPYCSTKNKALVALVVDNDGCKDLTNYPEVKVTGLKIKTRRN